MAADSDDFESLLRRTKDLEAELRLALGATLDIKALRRKLQDSCDSLREEKIYRLKCEEIAKERLRRQTIFGDHMEVCF